MESAKNPYVNIMVVRDADKNQPWVAQLIKSYHSEEVRQFIEKGVQGLRLPGVLMITSPEPLCGFPQGGRHLP